MLHPTKYAAMLAEKMQKHGATGWLVNTGWSGGRYGSGSRIKLSYTRKIIDAIHSAELLNVDYHKTKVFGLEIPTAIEGVPSEILDPMNTVRAKWHLVIEIFLFHFTTFFKLGGSCSGQIRMRIMKRCWNWRVFSRTILRHLPITRLVKTIVWQRKSLLLVPFFKVKHKKREKGGFTIMENDSSVFFFFFFCSLNLFF